jgi:hypothetical protein
LREPIGVVLKGFSPGATATIDFVGKVLAYRSSDLAKKVRAVAEPLDPIRRNIIAKDT